MRQFAEPDHHSESEMFKGDWRRWARKIPTLTMWYRGAMRQFLESKG